MKDKKNKTSESQIAAVRKYESKNPEKALAMRYRTTARTFVRHHATMEDMAELEEIFKKENKNYREK